MNLNRILIGTLVAVGLLAAGCKSSSNSSSAKTSTPSKSETRGARADSSYGNGARPNSAAAKPAPAPAPAGGAANSLPANVADAANKQVPGGSITSANQKNEAGVTVWEIMMNGGGQMHEMLIRNDGVVLRDRVRR